MSVTPCGRLAPSPTGALHLGNIRTFLIAWLRIRAARGTLILRMEDLDHPKHKPGAEQGILDDLRWLGFDWDAYDVQTHRLPYYADALARLRAGGHVYPCVCSRRDVESAQSAPHAEDGLYYPGTCRDRFTSYEQAAAILPAGRMPAWRFRVPLGTITYTDAFAGIYTQDVATASGDFALARDANGAGYMLAAVEDDHAMGITEVVRGDDLLPATPRQLLIYRALGYTPPSFVHVPLVVGPDGKRLAKRHGDTRIASFREHGISPDRVIGFLASTCGWVAPGATATLPSLLTRFTMDTIPHTPVVWNGSFPD